MIKELKDISVGDIWEYKESLYYEYKPKYCIILRNGKKSWATLTSTPIQCWSIE